MSKQLNKDQDPLFKWIQEAGHQQPSPDFFLSVMTKLDQEKPIKSYEPVFSRIHWILIALFIGSIIAFSLIPTASAGTWSEYLLDYVAFDLPAISLKAPHLDIPSVFTTKVMLQSIISFGLLSLALLAMRIKNLKTQ
ncbi:hypothetical protein [Algoriphagus vanfongensis]|uniref:hypothetical protein n=1 Tax=Algoriphagus vanfongensis TaxID=426371 RepID=UPI00047EBBD0|nr:hypothetical protein [Algoriphagus vanfongensis]